MARFTSNQWAIIETDGQVNFKASDSQTLFRNYQICSENGKLSLKQAVYKLNRLSKEIGAIRKLVSLKDDTLYVFEHVQDIGKGQAEFLIAEYTDGLLYESVKIAFGGDAKKSKTKSKTNTEPKTEPKTEPNPKTESKSTEQTAEQLMIQAMQLMSKDTKGSVDVEQVQTIVKDEISKLDRPRIVTIEVKLPKGSKTSVTGQHKEFNKLLKLVGAKKSVMLVGDAGSGKTYGSKMVAKTLELDYRIFSFTNETSLGRTMGFMNAMGEYVGTAVREMYENGGLLILDEFDACNANVAMSLNNLLDGDEYVFADKVVKRHEDFLYVACTNTYAGGGNEKYDARNKIDDSTMDRFSAIIDWGYDEVLERRLFGDTEATRVVQQIRNNANKMGLNGLVTPRRTRDVNDMVSIGFKLKEAVHMSILAKQKKDVQVGLTEGVTL